MRALTITTILLALLTAGCDFFSFDDFKSSAGVQNLGRPAVVQGRGFGTTLTAYVGDLEGQRVSRIAAGAGRLTGMAVYPVWEEGELLLGPAVFEECGVGVDCNEAGNSIAGMPAWGGKEMCVILAGDVAYVLCESDGFFEQTRLDTPGIATEVATVLVNPDPEATAFLGAPEGVEGSIFRVPDGAEPIALDVSAAMVEDGSELGATMAATRTGSGETLLAAAAPGMDRVVVIRLSEGAGTVTVDACLNGADGFGGALAFGQVGASTSGMELVVGSTGAASIYSVDDLVGMAGAGCTGADGPSAQVELACPDDPVRGDEEVGCGGFGAAVAIGDLDGNDTGELLVGAPLTEVGGTAGAGAVFVYVDNGTDLIPTDALTHTTPGEADSLGEELTVVRTHLGGNERDEVVAGAPGDGSVVVFLCSGLDGDTPESVGQRCVVSGS